MKNSTKLFLGAVSLAGVVTAAAPAFAQDAPAWALAGTVAVTSDYKFRGISQGERNFAPQGSLTVTGPDGFYVSAWASQVDFTPGSSNDPQVELDIYGGKHTDLWGVDWNFMPGGGVCGVCFTRPACRRSPHAGAVFVSTPLSDRVVPPDTRLHRRRKAHGRFALRPAGRPDAAPIDGELVDISPGGVGLLADRAVDVGQVVVLVLWLEDGPTVTFEAVVNWLAQTDQPGRVRLGCLCARPLSR